MKGICVLLACIACLFAMTPAAHACGGGGVALAPAFAFNAAPCYASQAAFVPSFAPSFGYSAFTPSFGFAAPVAIVEEVRFRNRARSNVQVNVGR